MYTVFLFAEIKEIPVDELTSILSNIPTFGMLILQRYKVYKFSSYLNLINENIERIPIFLDEQKLNYFKVR